MSTVSFGEQHEQHHELESPGRVLDEPGEPRGCAKVLPGDLWHRQHPHVGDGEVRRTAGGEKVVAKLHVEVHKVQVRADVEQLLQARPAALQHEDVQGDGPISICHQIARLVP